MIGGGGGGSPEMAQAGGPKPERLEEALGAVYDIVYTNSSQISGEPVNPEPLIREF